MKHFFLLIVILCSLTSFTSAQDLIIKNNGDTIKCRVLEVNVDIIKCQDYSSPDGQVYNFLRQDIYKIHYKDGEEILANPKPGDPGYYEVDSLFIKRGLFGLRIFKDKERLRSSEVRNLYAEYPWVLSRYNNGKAIKFFSNIIFIPATLIFLLNAGAGLAGAYVSGKVIAISGAGVLSGFILKSISSRNIRASVWYYNKKIKKQPSISMHFGLTDYGVGLNVKF
ncbi:MAG: hypothetical protein ABFS05_11370 [Bacteroidota bacterium]